MLAVVVRPAGIFGLPAEGCAPALRFELVQALVEGMAQNVPLEGRKRDSSVNVGFDFKFPGNATNAEISQPKFFHGKIRIPQHLFESEPLLILVLAQGQNAPPITCRLPGLGRQLQVHLPVEALPPSATPIALHAAFQFALPNVR
jgi:hypothetical protein